MIGRVVAATYVLTVAVIATIGFTTGSTAPILLAGLLALPTSIPAIVGYYVVYGLLAQVPGANPANGELAPWFALTAEVLGILALSIAALVNIGFIRLARGKRVIPARTRSQTP